MSPINSSFGRGKAVLSAPGIAMPPGNPQPASVTCFTKPSCRVDPHVRICLCRDSEQLLAEALPPRSLIVIGGRKRWWRTAEQALASRLRRRGHEIIYADLERSNHA